MGDKMGFISFFVFLSFLGIVFSMDDVTRRRILVLKDFHSCMTNVVNGTDSFRECEKITRACLDDLFKDSESYLSHKNEFVVKADIEMDLRRVLLDCRMPTRMEMLKCQLDKIGSCLNQEENDTCDELKKLNTCLGPYSVTNCTRRNFPSVLRRISLGMWETLKCRTARKPSGREYYATSTAKVYYPPLQYGMTPKRRSDDMEQSWEDMDPSTQYGTTSYDTTYYVATAPYDTTTTYVVTPKYYQTTKRDDYGDKPYYRMNARAQNNTSMNISLTGRNYEHVSSRSVDVNHNENETIFGRDMISNGSLPFRSLEGNVAWSGRTATPNVTHARNDANIKRQFNEENLTRVDREVEHFNLTRTGREHFNSSGRLLDLVDMHPGTRNTNLTSSGWRNSNGSGRNFTTDLLDLDRAATLNCSHGKNHYNSSGRHLFENGTFSDRDGDFNLSSARNFSRVLIEVDVDLDRASTLNCSHRRNHCNSSLQLLSNRDGDLSHENDTMDGRQMYFHNSTGEMGRNHYNSTHKRLFDGAARSMNNTYGSKRFFPFANEDNTTVIVKKVVVTFAGADINENGTDGRSRDVQMFNMTGRPFRNLLSFDGNVTLGRSDYNFTGRSMVPEDSDNRTAKNYGNASPMPGGKSLYTSTTPFYYVKGRQLITTTENSSTTESRSTNNGNLAYPNALIFITLVVKLFV